MIDSLTWGLWLYTRTVRTSLVMPVTLARRVRQPTQSYPGTRGRAGRDIMRGVTTAAPTISQRVHSLNRPNMVSVGTIVWLSSELMFFAGLFAMFFTVKAQNTAENWPPNPPGWSEPEPFVLNLPWALPFTIILVASSFTCQLGVFAAERGDVFGLRRWYLLTLFMGAVFLFGQVYEYFQLVDEGVTLQDRKSVVEGTRVAA